MTLLTSFFNSVWCTDRNAAGLFMSFLLCGPFNCQSVTLKWWAPPVTEDKPRQCMYFALKTAIKIISLCSTCTHVHTHTERKVLRYTLNMDTKVIIVVMARVMMREWKRQINTKRLLRSRWSRVKGAFLLTFKAISTWGRIFFNIFAMATKWITIKYIA